MRYRNGVEATELQEGLRRDLEMAEVFARREFVITSGFREGDDRCHGYGRAVDIACGNSNDRFRIVAGLIKAGFDRIGVYSWHVHVDVCKREFPSEVLWLGGASK